LSIVEELLLSSVELSSFTAVGTIGVCFLEPLGCHIIKYSSISQVGVSLLPFSFSTQPSFWLSLSLTFKSTPIGDEDDLEEDFLELLFVVLNVLLIPSAMSLAFCFTTFTAVAAATRATVFTAATAFFFT